MSQITISYLLQRFSKPTLVHHQAEEKEEQVNTETNPLPDNLCQKSQKWFPKPTPVHAKETEETVIAETISLPNNQCHKSQQKLSKPAPVQAEETEETVIAETIPLPDNQCPKSQLWEDHADHSANP